MNLKDQFFNEKTLNDFLDELSVYHEFDQLGFLNKALNRFPLLELLFLWESPQNGHATFRRSV